jgi:hypothetical protein
MSKKEADKRTERVNLFVTPALARKIELRRIREGRRTASDVLNPLLEYAMQR